MGESNPVVKVKPKRTREMRSTVVPQEMLNTMHLVSAKKTLRGDIDATPLLKDNKAGGAEIYHEGYVGGKKYLVPDSNLEAMKDIINLKMRPRRSTRYKHQTSYDLGDYDHFKSKISKIIEKIDQASPSDSSEDNKKTKPETVASSSLDKSSSISTRVKDIVSSSDDSSLMSEPKQDSKKKPSLSSSLMSQPKEDSKKKPSLSSSLMSQPIQDSKKKPSLSSADKYASPKSSSESITDDEKDKDKKKEEKSSIEDFDSLESETPEQIQKLPSYKDEPVKKITPLKADEHTFENISLADSNKSQVRFLISGHFKSDDKPIYIIQEYTGNHIFENEKTAFSALQKEGNVDIFISGKMYEENILEESDGKPIFLNTKPDKIFIDENKSKIFYDYFEDIFHMKSADITVKGEFIKNEITDRITPFLSFGVKQTKDS